MVLGDRLVSAVGAVGVSKYPPTARKRAEAGDVILLTEGSGGGTISTTALYHGMLAMVWEDFIGSKIPSSISNLYKINIKRNITKNSCITIKTIINAYHN